MFNFFTTVILFLFAVTKHGAESGNHLNKTLQTCGTTTPDGINAFTLRASSHVGDIPLIHFQFDVKRKLPITSTYIQDQLNVQSGQKRRDHFRTMKCDSLKDHQQNCGKSFHLSEFQKQKIDEDFKSWDRGQLTPAGPMTFSGAAVDVTFYCVNIAPQEPWTNRCPWYAVEERVLNKAKSFPSYVMTGLCPKECLEDGPAEHDIIIPECFWKLMCYLDAVSNETKVIGWIGKKFLFHPETKEEDKAARMEATLLPRSQQEILKLMGARKDFVKEAWLAAEVILKEGRNNTGLPGAATCHETTKISKETKEEWEAFMKKHRPPSYCLKRKKSSEKS